VISAVSAVSALLWSLAAQAAAIPACPEPGSGWCIARRFAGSIPGGELGFRFGAPLDMDGDGRADVAAGARFKLQGTNQTGMAAVWSGANGNVIRAWDGEIPNGLFGHWAMPIPDLGHDGLADVVIAAPLAAVDDQHHGVLVARSPKTGEELWKHAGGGDENLGWDLALANDQNGDGRVDLFAGAPGGSAGHVYLLSGRDGSLLRTYGPPTGIAGFGWFVARLEDVDGDGHADLAVGANWEKDDAGAYVGGAFVISAASGKELQHWKGTTHFSGFGEVVAAAPDVDGDGRGDVAVASPRTNDQTRTHPGEVSLYSASKGTLLRQWSGSQPGELYGRMIFTAGDLDGDGIDDLAIGAPWYRRGDEQRVGRVEFRSAKSGEVLGELFGAGADDWFGWHIRNAPDPDGKGRPALLIGSLRHQVDGQPGVGVIDLYVWRRPPAQGTTTRAVRRNDIK